MRNAVFAGKFYPKEARLLTDFFIRYLALNSDTFLDHKYINALIVPHAGYQFSGKICANAFKYLSNSSYKSIVILGPSHQYSFTGASIDCQASYETPLESISVDRDLCNLLLGSSDLLHFDEKAHISEHSIEVLCPFISYLFQDKVDIVPIIIGDTHLDTIFAVVNALTAVCKPEDTLIIASSDFSHFFSANVAESMDLCAIKLIESFDFDSLYHCNQLGDIQMCGISPIMVLGHLMKAWSITDMKSCGYTHSGTVSGDLSSVVGYYSSVFYSDYV